MKKMSLRVIAMSAFIFIMLAMSTSALAQVSADLSGTTKDSTGAVIPNAQVAVRNTATNLTRNTQSDEEGRYAFPNLPIGSYEITASYKGFQTTKLATELTVGQKAELDITLSPSGVSAHIVVESGEQHLQRRVWARFGRRLQHSNKVWRKPSARDRLRVSAQQRARRRELL